MRSHFIVPRSYLVTVDITPDAPPAYLALVWEEFFASRSRGVSLKAHFPWLSAEHSYFATVREGAEIVGGLAVNPVKRGEYVAGIIGLVCVHPERRGRGHSRTALLASISHAGRLGTDDLLLWTGKPDVYEASGFKVYDTALYGWASGLSAPGRAGAVRAPWPTPGEQRGLPPFASKAYRWTTPFASAIIVHDASGPILAEWSGSDEEVVALLAQAMPERWRINVLFSDTLPATLRKACAAVDLKPSNLQMVLNLRRRDDQSTDPYRLRVLDRI